EVALETGLLTVAVGPGCLDRAHGLDVGRVAAHSGVAVAAGRGRGQVSLTAIGRVGVAVVETGVADAGTVDAHRVCTTGRIARGGVRRVRIRCVCSVGRVGRVWVGGVRVFWRIWLDVGRGVGLAHVEGVFGVGL